MISIKRSIPVILRPSEATPTVPYFLSNLDQTIPVLIKSINYWHATCRQSFANEEISHILKTSLEKVLVYFYPFVGRLSIDQDQKFLVLFDQPTDHTNYIHGVPFVEATADSSLQHFVDTSSQNSQNNNNMNQLQQLVYRPATPRTSILDLPLLAVQLTMFKCGSFTAGVTMNHLIVDGISIGNFCKAWAETARGFSLSLSPYLDRSMLRAAQPPVVKFQHQGYLDLAPNISSHNSSDTDLPRCCSFLFDSSKISRLKQQLGSGHESNTFATLAGFIWYARTKALKIPSDQPTKLLFTVDIRNRLEPPLPPGFFGNGIVFACCLCPAGLLTNSPLCHAVEMIEKAKQEVTNRFVRSEIDFFELTRPRPSLAGAFIITSWTRIDTQPIDFGWGPPASFDLAEMFAQELAIIRSCGQDAKSLSITLTLPASAIQIFEYMMNF